MSLMVLTVVGWPGAVSAQGGDFRVDMPHPRLLLNAHRLKLLKKERERQSLRWNQFELLMAGKAPMPEPGFADALYYQVGSNVEAGNRAITWALGQGTDLRQLALVFDWCRDLLNDGQAKALTAKIVRGMQASAKETSCAAARSRILASVAISGEASEIAEREMNQIVHNWWEGQIGPSLNAGREALTLDDTYALFEMLHVLRDNLNLDLRETSPRFFRDLAMVHLLSYYPASFPAGENEYRIPATVHATSEPDLNRAALARAADFAMVAYDTNAPGSQILQGWLMNDNYLLRGTFGAPYEFLWANPYQPGLSYYHAPKVLHDELIGRLFVRSNWEESASWLGFFDGELQLFEDGRVTALNAHLAAEPLSMGSADILFGANTQKFKVAVEGEEPVFVVGLKPRRTYVVEVDDEEMTEAVTDPGGVLGLDMPHKAATGVRVSEWQDTR
ncbi:MAG: hypothetical protein U0Q18_22745 [Bryobacteraceae bacterium]